MKSNTLHLNIYTTSHPSGISFNFPLASAVNIQTNPHAY